MNNIFRHIRVCIIRGILAVIPLTFCAIAVALLYELIDKKVMGFLDRFVDVHHVPGFGILLLLAFLFLIGLIVSSVFGRQMLGLVEYVGTRIPGIKQIYSMSKLVGDALGGPQGKDIFKRAVLVNYPNADQWTAALVAGYAKDLATGEDWLKVYVPMGHPLIGFMFLVQEKNVKDPGWPVEEVLKMVVSLGLLAPKKA